VGRPKTRELNGKQVTWMAAAIGAENDVTEDIAEAHAQGKLEFAMACWECGTRCKIGSQRYRMWSPSAPKKRDGSKRYFFSGCCGDAACETAIAGHVAAITTPKPASKPERGGIPTWDVPEDDASKPEPEPEPEPQASGDTGGTLEGILRDAVAAEVTKQVADAFPEGAPTPQATKTVEVVLVDPEDREPVTLPESAHERLPVAILKLQALGGVWLVGPAGTGKTFAASQMAGTLGREFFEMTCNGSMSHAGFVGMAMPGARDQYIGTAVTAALDASREGTPALLLIDEWDRLDESVAIALHGLLQGEGVSTPQREGMPVTKGGDIAFVLTSNTFGTDFGSVLYTAATKLDAATLDRMRLAKVWWEYDVAVERGFVAGYKLPEKIAQRFWRMRDVAREQRLDDVIVSTRAFRDAGKLYQASPDLFGANDGQRLVDDFLLGASETTREKLGGE
jgi:MoxR-like ATPase